jgi:hypothetical protein
MLKQQTVPTSLGPLTVSSLTLGELRQLDQLFASAKMDAAASSNIGSLLKYMPLIFTSARKVHQDLTLETLENGLTLDDFNAVFGAVLEVSGLKKASPGDARGEAQPAQVAPV